MTFSAAKALMLVASAANPVAMQNPAPTLAIFAYQMPQQVIEETVISEVSEHSAVATYHEIKQKFAVSNKAMSEFLGVKRRSMYNWLSDPDRASKVGPEIEERLTHLKSLLDDMEPEHHQLLSKIAFSPILGDKQFGEALLDGKSGTELIKWYDRLYSKFETYKKMAAKNIG